MSAVAVEVHQRSSRVSYPARASAPPSPESSSSSGSALKLDPHRNFEEFAALGERIREVSSGTPLKSACVPDWHLYKYCREIARFFQQAENSPNFYLHLPHGIWLDIRPHQTIPRVWVLTVGQVDPENARKVNIIGRRFVTARRALEGVEDINPHIVGDTLKFADWLVKDDRLYKTFAQRLSLDMSEEMDDASRRRVISHIESTTKISSHVMLPWQAATGSLLQLFEASMGVARQHFIGVRVAGLSDRHVERPFTVGLRSENMLVFVAQINPTRQPLGSVSLGNADYHVLVGRTDRLALCFKEVCRWAGPELASLFQNARTDFVGLDDREFARLLPNGSKPEKKEGKLRLTGTEG